MEGGGRTNQELERERERADRDCHNSLVEQKSSWRERERKRERERELCVPATTASSV